MPSDPDLYVVSSYKKCISSLFLTRYSPAKQLISNISPLASLTLICWALFAYSCFWTVGGNRSNRSKNPRWHGGNMHMPHKGPLSNWDLNPGCCCCEATVLTTNTLCGRKWLACWPEAIWEYNHIAQDYNRCSRSEYYILWSTAM